MANIALYRKYRSQSFEDLIGQGHITKTLQSALENGRNVQAYLFTGPRGTGKTSAARIFAKSLNCVSGPTPTPCNECPICVAVTAGSHPDVLEMDAASEAGVDKVRENIIENARYAPMEARFKVYIIDEVHDLSSKAFDALLKTIEEPPPHVIFVLATTEFAKVPVTIRSRCQRYEFHRGSLRDIAERLEFVCRNEGWEAEPSALATIARMADGGFRDALTLLEQAAITSGGGAITLEGVSQQLGLLDEAHVDRILLAASSGDVQELLYAADEAVRTGKEPREVFESMLYRLSVLTYVAFDADGGQVLDPEKRAADHSLAVRLGKSNLLHYRSILADAYKQIREIGLPRLWLEVTLLQLMAPAPPSAPVTAAVPTAKQETKPKTPEPTPQPPVQTRAASAEFAEMQTAWNQTVTNLAKKFPKAGPLLHDTVVVGRSDKLLTLEVKRKLQYDRLMGKDDIRRTILEQFQETMGDNKWRIEFVASEQAEHPQHPEPEAVQSPLQGESLANAVEQLFGATPE